MHRETNSDAVSPTVSVEDLQEDTRANGILGALAIAMKDGDLGVVSDAMDAFDLALQIWEPNLLRLVQARAA